MDRTHALGRDAVKIIVRMKKTLEMVERRVESWEQAGKLPSSLSSDSQHSTCSPLVCLLLAGHEEIALKYFLERFKILDGIQA